MALRTKKAKTPREGPGECARCLAPLESAPEINSLTGRQLIRDGEPVEIHICSKRCGYSYRPKAKRRPK